MADYMIRASAADNFVRAFAVTSRGVTEYARKAHNLSPVASAALGRTMAAGLMMGAMMKGEKDVLTIQFKGDGPLGGITVTSSSDGSVKGYVGNPGVILPPNEYGHFDVGGAVGKGILHVMRDIGLKEPYAGQVDIQSGEIAQDIAYYYALSEQVPTVCALGVLMNKDNTVRESGGYMIQLMPDCPEEVIARLERKVTAMPSVTELLRKGRSPEDILKDILGEMKLEIHESMPVRFRCVCSRERVTAALIALGRKELTAIIDDGKPETLNCGFCNTDYTFTVEEMREILRQCRR
ncbi:MAG: Hsp33 family molecular chaperone HslO [Lachnospiraceae bacterium]|nr:Hsp33 family molecular chaperone HslO [Lachnospiraceae bacterium]